MSVRSSFGPVCLADAIPSFKELDNDMRRLSDAVFTLSRILLTSSSFRLLLSDVLLTSRALLADAAAEVGQVAHVVESRAGSAEKALRTGDKETEPPGNGLEEAAKQVKDGIKDVGEDTKEKWEGLGAEAFDRLKESAVNRLQKVSIPHYPHPYTSPLICMYIIRFLFKHNMSQHTNQHCRLSSTC